MLPTLLLVTFLSLLSLSTSTSLRPWFYVKQGQLDPSGGCDAYYDKMQQAYQEVVDLADGAMRTITQLRQAPPTEASDYDGYHRWNKAATSLYDLFSISVNANTGTPQSSDATAALDTIFKIFKDIKDHSDDNVTPVLNTQTRKKLFCGDKFAAYIRDGAQGPNGNTPPSGRNWWVDPGPNTEGLRGWWHSHKPKDPNKPEAGWCGTPASGTVPETGDGDEESELNAATGQSWNYVYFCKKILDAGATIGGTTIQSAPDAVAARTGGQGTSLNDVKGLSRTMLHEFIHLYSPTKDLLAPRMDRATGKPVKINGQCVEDDGTSRASGVPRKVYGYNWAYGSARCFPYNSNGGNTLAKYRNLGTVDPYVMFAMSMKFPRYTFVGEFGRALEIPPSP